MSATATGGHERGIEARRRGPRLPARLLRLASDERLVEALRGGNEAAFEVLYTRHHRGVLSFSRHMLGSAEEAEDAVQHTFLAAYRDLLRSDKPIRLRPWLYAIARNRCLSVLRARRERPGDDQFEPATEHLSNEVERRHDLRALLGDLAGLPPDQRAALVLAELGDMSHDEIGDVLACPREKVKALVFQARSSLIASRTARETPCEEIRQQLANLRGGSLRRNTLKRHLRDCEGCREFRHQVAAQRNALALILPVAPSLGLKATVLGAAGVTAAGGGSSAVATTVVVLCVAGGGTAAVDIARNDKAKRPEAQEPRPTRVVPAAAAPAAPEVVPAAAPQPKTRRGAGPTDRGRPGRDRAKRRAAKDRRAAARPPAASTGGPKPGKARNPAGSPPAHAGVPGRPPHAGVPGRPSHAAGPRGNRSKPAKIRSPKAAVPKPAKAPKAAPKAPATKPDKSRGSVPPPKAEEPAAGEPKADKAPAPRPEEPAGGPKPGSVPGPGPAPSPGPKRS